MSRNLSVVYEKGEELNGDFDNTLIITEEIKKKEQKSVLENHHRIQSIELSCYTYNWKYKLLEHHFASTREKKGIHDCLIIHDSLLDFTTSDLNTVTIANEVPDKYVKTVHDTFEGSDVEIAVDNYWVLSQKLQLVKQKLRAFVNLLLLLPFVIGGAFRSLFDSETIKARTVIIPVDNRVSHIQTILPELTQYVVPTTFPHKANIPGEVELYRFVSTREILSDAVSLFNQVLSSFILQDDFSDTLTTEFNSNVCYTVPRTIQHTVLSCLTASNIRDFWWYLVYLRVLENSQASNVVVGGLTMRCKAALLAGEQTNHDTFYLPHSITYPFHPAPPSESTFFITESLDMEYWKHRIEHSQLRRDNLVETGRLDLQEHFRYFDKKAADTSEISVLIATQPHTDDIRTEFVEYILAAVASSTQNFDVKIKIHPDECKDFYSDFPVSDILDSELHSAIDEADLVCVITSNVGIISLSRKTPVISVNPWKPLYKPLYTQDSPVPMIESRESLNELFATLTRDKTTELTNEQVRFFEEMYYFQDYKTKIVNSIDNRKSKCISK